MTTDRQRISGTRQLMLVTLWVGALLASALILHAWDQDRLGEAQDRFESAVADYEFALSDIDYAQEATTTVQEAYSLWGDDPDVIDWIFRGGDSLEDAQGAGRKCSKRLYGQENVLTGFAVPGIQHRLEDAEAALIGGDMAECARQLTAAERHLDRLATPDYLPEMAAAAARAVEELQEAVLLMTGG